MYSSCYYLKWTLSRAQSPWTFFTKSSSKIKFKMNCSCHCCIGMEIFCSFNICLCHYRKLETSVKPCVWALHLWMLESTWQRRIFTVVYFPVTRSMCEDNIIKLYLTLSNLANIKINYTIYLYKSKKKRGKSQKCYSTMDSTQHTQLTWSVRNFPFMSHALNVSLYCMSGYWRSLERLSTLFE